MNEEELEKMAEQLSWADVPKCVEEIKKLWQEADEAAAFLLLVQNDLRREAGERDALIKERELNELQLEAAALNHEDLGKVRDIAVEGLGLAVSVLGSTKYVGSDPARESWETDKNKVMKAWYADINGMDWPPKEGA